MLIKSISESQSMQDQIQQFKRQLEKFKNIKFIADDHTYLINDRVAQSVTTILKKYVKPFDRDYWANIKARQAGVEAEEILDKWEFAAKSSRIKGSLVHEYIEYSLTKQQFTYPEDSILEVFGYDPIQTPFNQIIPVVEKFLSDINDKMFPVVSEFIIGDAESLICGTIDQLFYNKKSGKLEIWDWKTNKEIKLESRYFHLAPLQHIPDTELDHYSLQLSLYKLILERNTGIALGNSYITWFNESHPDYRIFAAKNYVNEAQIILNAMLKENNNAQ